jgi:hypothetical protein
MELVQWTGTCDLQLVKVIFDHVYHMPLLHCTAGGKTWRELISEMAAADLIYGKRGKGATGTQRGRRMLHLETNCRSIEPPAGEIEWDQLSASCGFVIFKTCNILAQNGIILPNLLWKVSSQITKCVTFTFRATSGSGPWWSGAGNSWSTDVCRIFGDSVICDAVSERPWAFTF